MSRTHFRGGDLDIARFPKSCGAGSVRQTSGLSERKISGRGAKVTCLESSLSTCQSACNSDSASMCLHVKLSLGRLDFDGGTLCW